MAETEVWMLACKGLRSSGVDWCAEDLGEVRALRQERVRRALPGKLRARPYTPGPCGGLHCQPGGWFLVKTS